MDNNRIETLIYSYKTLKGFLILKENLSTVQLIVDCWEYSLNDERSFYRRTKLVEELRKLKLQKADEESKLGSINYPELMCINLLISLIEEVLEIADEKYAKNSK